MIPAWTRGQKQKGFPQTEKVLGKRYLTPRPGEARVTVSHTSQKPN